MARRILLVSNTSWNILNFRMNLARALVEQGYEVHTAGNADEYGEAIREQGFPWHEWKLARRSINPLRELSAIGSLDSIYRRVRPDLVHHFTVKPILYGTAIARARRIPAVVNSVTGLPYFIVSQPKSGVRGLARTTALQWYSWSLAGDDVCPMFQNDDDLSVLASVDRSIAARSVKTAGSGVDLNRFGVVSVDDDEPDEIVVTFVGRLIREKGIFEFVEAARNVGLRTQRPVRFLVCGGADYGNRSAVLPETLSNWKRLPRIEFLGHVSDVSQVLRRSHLVVLPSYREGTPRCLLEAAACGLPVIASDVPGCREVVRHRESGLLVSARDAELLADAILELTSDWERMREMGRVGRKLAMSQFSESTVIERTLDVYSKLIGPQRSARAA